MSDHKAQDARGTGRAGPAPAALDAPARARVALLEQVFARIGATRMQGVPVLNPALRVQALGFAAEARDGGSPVLQGILITPWFMNLVRLPLGAQPDPGAPGAKQQHRFGTQVFEFIAGHEDALGAYEACSLFSPMFEFADQAGAVATAQAVLDQLRAPPPPPAPDAPAQPARRGFLLGRMRPGAAP